MQEVKLNLEDIVITQRFEYMKNNILESYYKDAPIKHRRKKINNINYNTKKSKLIFYKNIFRNDNNFDIIFIYETIDNQYFKRIFNQLGEIFDTIKKEEVIHYFNNNNSLF